MTDLVRPVWRNLECPVDIWGPTGTEASPRRAKYLSLIYSRSEINGGSFNSLEAHGGKCLYFCLFGFLHDLAADSYFTCHFTQYLRLCVPISGGVIDRRHQPMKKLRFVIDGFSF